MNKRQRRDATVHQPAVYIYSVNAPKGSLRESKHKTTENRYKTRNVHSWWSFLIRLTAACVYLGLLTQTCI